MEILKAAEVALELSSDIIQDIRRVTVPFGLLHVLHSKFTTIFKDITLDGGLEALGDGKVEYLDSLRCVTWLIFIILRRTDPNIGNKLLQNANAMLSSLYFTIRYCCSACDLKFLVGRPNESKGQVVVTHSERLLPDADLKILDSLSSLLGCKLNEQLQLEINDLIEQIKSAINRAGLQEEDGYLCIGHVDRITVLQRALEELYQRFMSSDDLDEKLFESVNPVESQLSGLDPAQVHSVHEIFNSQPQTEDQRPA